MSLSIPPGSQAVIRPVAANPFPTATTTVTLTYPAGSAAGDFLVFNVYAYGADALANPAPVSPPPVSAADPWTLTITGAAGAPGDPGVVTYLGEAILHLTTLVQRQAFRLATWWVVRGAETSVTLRMGYRYWSGPTPLVDGSIMTYRDAYDNVPRGYTSIAQISTFSPTSATDPAPLPTSAAWDIVGLGCVSGLPVDNGFVRDFGSTIGQRVGPVFAWHEPVVGDVTMPSHQNNWVLFSTFYLLAAPIRARGGGWSVYGRVVTGR